MYLLKLGTTCNDQQQSTTTHSDKKIRHNPQQLKSTTSHSDSRNNAKQSKTIHNGVKHSASTLSTQEIIQNNPQRSAETYNNPEVTQ